MRLYFLIIEGQHLLIGRLSTVKKKRVSPLFFIDEKIDTGAVILQSKIDINPTENAGELHDKLMHLGS